MYKKEKRIYKLVRKLNFTNQSIMLIYDKQLIEKVKLDII